MNINQKIEEILDRFTNFYWETGQYEKRELGVNSYKNFISQSLTQFAQDITEEMVVEERLTNDLKSEKQCTFYTDHNPVWDGNFYTCSECGIEFLPAREINKVLEAIKAKRDKILGI